MANTSAANFISTTLNSFTNNMKKTYILLISILTLFSACRKEAGMDDGFGEGTGALRLERPSVQSETEIPVIVTKGSFGLEPSAFSIRIDRQGADGTYAKHTGFDSYSAMIDAGMPLVLPVGDYRVVASSYDQAAAGGRVSETPYFEGRQEFVIEEKTVTSVPAFTCTFESVGVELRLSDRFKAKIEAEPLNYSYSVTVYDGEVSWTFDPDKHTKPAYFLDDCESLSLKVTVTLDGRTYPVRTYYVCNSETGKVSTGEYYMITLDTGETETKGLRLTTKCIGE